jgi:hypothetical protein
MPDEEVEQASKLIRSAEPLSEQDLREWQALINLALTGPGTDTGGEHAG